MKTRLNRYASLLLLTLCAPTLLACDFGHHHKIDNDTDNHHISTPNSCVAVDCGQDFTCIVEDYENPQTGTADERPACILEE